MKIKTVYNIDVQEWDAIVRNTYNRPYSFQQQDGCKERAVFEFSIPDTPDDYENDTVPEVVNHPEMGVSFDAWLKRDPEQLMENQKYDWELEIWWGRNFYPDVQMIANDLHSKGLLEAGLYQIDIDW